MAVVSCIIQGSCKDRHLAFLLRELNILAILNNFSFTVVHIPGMTNTAADALSRFNFQAFADAAPTADSSSTAVPTAFLQQLLFPPWTRNGSSC